MPTDTDDDNPFARETIWPKMPQEAFKVGPLPKADGADLSPPEPAPAPAAHQAITPVFVRPATGGAPIGPLAGITPLSTRSIPPRPQPFASGEPQMPRGRIRQPPPVAPPSPPPQAAPEPAQAAIFEVEPLIVSPTVAARPRPARRRSNLPLIAAGLAAIAGVAGLIAVTTLIGRDSAPAAPKSAAVAPLPAPAVVTTTPPPAEVAPAAVVAATPPVRVAAKAPARAVRIPAIGFDEPIVSTAPSSGPLPIVEAAPRPPPPATPAPAEPTYRPPAAPDPNAPVTTTRPY